MLNTYDMAMLKMKLNSGDSIEPSKAIYTLVKHIEGLEDKIAELERRMGEPRAGQDDSH